MKVLAFDTSTDWLSVAVYDGREAIGMRERVGTGSSERILPAIAETLAHTNASLADIGVIAFGAGPGSFTGIRIACGVAQGLAFGCNLRVLGVPTLGAIAQGAWRANGSENVVACIDARMREVYVAAYARESTGWVAIRDAIVCKPEEIADLPAAREWRGAGNGFAAYPELAARLGLASCDASIIPDAQSIAEWAWTHALAGDGVAAEQAQPLYVRHRVALTTAERAAGARL